jgi:hypothetical protein
MNRYNDLKLLIILAFSLPHPAFAGTISSGGGRIFRFENNPWYLENTKQVRYCIDVNESDFGVDYWTLAQRIEKGLDLWKAAFDETGEEYYSGSSSEKLEPYGQLRAATQTFVRVPCGPSVDIKMQFGSLTDNQRQWMDDPKLYVGNSVRTEYDLENLSSRGFIYLAPTQGELKPLVENLPSDLWRQFDYLALDLVLWHELGHVFGVGHDSLGSDSMLMSEMLPMYVASREFIHAITKMTSEDRRQIRLTLEPKRQLNSRNEGRYLGCGPQSPIQGATEYQPLGIPVADQCTLIELTDTAIKIYSSLNSDAEWVLRGTVKTYASGSSGTAGMRVWLPESQVVFNRLPISTTQDEFGFLRGEIRRTEQEWTGEFVPVDPSIAKLPLRLISKPGNVLEGLCFLSGQFQNINISLNEP